MMNLHPYAPLMEFYSPLVVETVFSYIGLDNHFRYTPVHVVGLLGHSEMFSKTHQNFHFF